MDQLSFDLDVEATFGALIWALGHGARATMMVKTVWAGPPRCWGFEANPGVRPHRCLVFMVIPGVRFGAGPIGFSTCIV